MGRDRWLEKFNYNIRLLDKIDMKPYIERGDSPDEIMEKIENAYENHELPKEVEELAQHEFLLGDIFNQVSTSDFMDYLENRYNIGFCDEIHYWVGSLPWN